MSVVSWSDQRFLALIDIFDNLGGGLIPLGDPLEQHSLDNLDTAGRGFRCHFLERHVLCIGGHTEGLSYYHR